MSIWRLNCSNSARTSDEYRHNKAIILIWNKCLRVRVYNCKSMGKVIKMKKALFFILILAAAAFGQEEYFGQNKVQYKNYDWYYIQTEHFDIYINRDQDTVATFAASELENAYQSVTKELNHELTSRVPVIIYSSPNDFQQTNIVSDLLPEGVGGFTEVFKTRVVVPFNGSYEDFRHVLHHELTHAVVYNLLYENAIGSLISSGAFFSQPLWLAEGYAEYSSRLGWTAEEDMYVRDAVIEGYLPPLPDLYGLLNYNAGHSAIIYIAETYGLRKIPELFNKGKVLLTMDRALKASLGTDIEKISKDWQKELKRIYWPEISKRKTPAETGKLLTEHQKEGSIYNMNPKWSTQNDRIAITSDRASPRDGYSDRFNEIYLISSVDGKVIEKLVEAEKSGDLESLHSYYSGMSWSPDGSKLVFVSKSHGQDALFFLDVASKAIYKKFRPGLESLRNPSWSPKGDKIAVTGVKKGYSDLYIYDLDTDQINRLTHDKYDDIEATFSPSGTKIAFASDRPFSVGGDTTFNYGTYNIFIFDLMTNDIQAITHDDSKSVQPDFHPEGKMLAYISYRNGIANVYIHDLVDGGDFPVTNVLSGVFSPSWSPDGSRLAVSIFGDYGFDIAILKDIKPINADSADLEPTIFKATGRLFPEKEPIVMAEPEPVVEKGMIDYSRYIFKTGAEQIEQESVQADSVREEQQSGAEAGPEQADTLDNRLADGSFKKQKYSLKFSPELISGGLSYDNFYGLRGQSFISVSDMFGNHQFYLMTDVFNTIDQSNIQIVYSYLARRIDYAIGAFHFKNIYYDEYNQYYFSDRVFGAAGLASYPFSRFSRLEAGLSQVTIGRENLDFDIPNSTTNLLQGSLSYITDGVVWGIVGPVYGHRYKLTVEQSLKAVSTGYSYTAVEGDYRKYFHFGDAYNFAVRFAGAASFGEDKKQYYLGGTSYWIGPSQKTNDIYGERDIYVNKLIVPLRGYRYFELKGTRYFLMNLELRYPFIDYLKMRWPLGLTLAQVRGSLFWDLGAAFDNNADFHLFDEKVGFPKLGTPKSGLGFGIQSNLGIFVLRFDVAWRTDLDSIAGKPNSYFSFGANY